MTLRLYGIAKSGSEDQGTMHELVEVVGVALAVKAVLFAALFASYAVFDTSSLLLFSLERADPTLWTRIARRFMAWDTVFFINTARHGEPVFEHEYAFSTLWASLIRQLSPQKSLTSLMLTAVVISVLSHVVATLCMAQLAQLPALRTRVNQKWAALIYSVSPAGVFMISGYTESSCAAFSLLGLLLLYKYRAYELAGACFGAATLLRANGLMWGICFALSLLNELKRNVRRWRWKRLARITIGGSLVGAAFGGPQMWAYKTFCRSTEPDALPAWCGGRLPSLYTHVQSKYWNNGFLNYWTLSNLPLFLLALPSLIVLVLSTGFLIKRKMYAIALVQLVMVGGLTFFWHVQIVNRVSSSLPGPALYLADLLKRRRPLAEKWIALFIVYGVVQAGLYGAFLPPA